MAETVGQYQQSAFANPQAGQRPIASQQVRDNDNAIRVQHNAHDSDAGVHFQSSTLASRPAFGTAGRKWLTTDGLRIYYDTGAAWVEAAYLPLAGGTVAGATTFTSTLTGTLTGNASTATALATARSIALGGVLAGSANFDGTAGITITAAHVAGSIVNADINASAGIVDTKLATISTAGKVSNSATTAASANTASAIVARDGSGNFSAGTVTVSGLTHTGTTITLRGVTYTLPAADGTSGQVLSTNGLGTLSWAAASAGFVTGSGTTGKLPKFTGSAALGDSIITESGTVIAVAGSVAAGTNPATTGSFRLPNAIANGIYGRNAANTANIAALSVLADNYVQVGAETLASVKIGGASSTIYIGGLLWPASDGTNGQVLTTNGSGTLSFTSATGLSGSGTTGKIAKFTGTSAAGDSIMTESGTEIDVAGNVDVGFTYVYKVNGTQVVAARNTGWTATWTGVTADKTIDTTNFSATPVALDDTPTLGNFLSLVGHFRALYEACASHGLIGA